jgi:ectoine hydroxylase-related dioxygenase (phytanoyl-CoA dioxygenase family)
VDVASAYRRDGFVSPLRVVDAEVAAAHRSRLDAVEAELGPQHYRVKAHTVMRSAWELATTPKLLDAVEQCIGPNVLIYDVTFIVKEPATDSYVGWHQDLTYWGLSDDDAQVSAWIALTPATELSGCMRMVPASHLDGRRDHVTKPEPAAVLDLGQQVEDIDEATSVAVPLQPGEASLHHGWTLHASAPNRSSERRIGLNVQFLAPHARQTLHDSGTAVLVRGVDDYGHFGLERPAAAELDRDALAEREKQHALMKDTYVVARDLNA